MCGIVCLAGGWAPGTETALSESLRHRGPDDHGERVDDELGVRLAMRRLSILDLEGGHQPMSNEDGSQWIIFNGEIFNSPELRARLEACGRRFRTDHSDTECLLVLYQELGEDMLAELNGMFAFVILDRRRRRLFGARDRFGIKPLYYAQVGGRLALASELKALLRLPGFSREIDAESLYHYLSLRYVPGGRSIFRDARRLEAGCAFSYDLATASLSIRRYWRPGGAPEEGRSEEDWCEIVRDELRAAVRRWVLSDVPVGCSLSGGLDSTAIVGLLAEAGRTVRTYTLGFAGAGEEAWSELALARKVAERWGTEHHELTLAPEALLDQLVPMVWHLDEPYGGGLPSWYVFQFMARHVKVALTGTGGDELFGGYGKWRSWEDSLPGARRGVRDRARRLAARLPARLLGPGTKRSLDRRLGPFAHPVDSYPLYLSDAEKRERVLAVPLSGIADTRALLRARYEDTGAGNVRDGFARLDLHLQLPDEFLLMTDRFSMAHSLEARVPFLDHVFAERIAGIPGPQRTRAPDLKNLLRKAVAPLLPGELLRAPKRGFVLPEPLWLRGPLRPLVERLLSPERLRKQALLHPTVYAEQVAPHLSGREPDSSTVWMLLMLQIWHVVFVERASLEAPGFSWRDLA